MKYQRDRIRDINYKLQVKLSMTSEISLPDYFTRHMPHLSAEQVADSIKFIESVDGYEPGFIKHPQVMSYDKKTDVLKIKCYPET